MPKHMQEQMLKLINAIRSETTEFLAEIAGPKEGEARDKMIRALLNQANHAEQILIERLLAAEPEPRPGCLPLSPAEQDSHRAAGRS